MFKKNWNVVFEEEEIKYIFTDLNTLRKKYMIRNWDKNRPADDTRVAEISDEKMNIIPGQICGWLKSGILYLYDGSHRYTAATKNICSNSNPKVYVKIIETLDENKIAQDFKTINKSISIPYLYLVEDSSIKISKINIIMDKFCNKWKAHQSPSRNPQRQNFNRDIFIEQALSQIKVDWLEETICDTLTLLIESVNEKAKSHVKENSIVHPKKCEFNNFFLMFLPTTKIISLIEKSSILI